MRSELQEYLMWYLQKFSQWVEESLRKTLFTQFNLRCICIEKKEGNFLFHQLQNLTVLKPTILKRMIKKML